MRRIAIVAAVAALGLALTGCGGDNKDQNASGTSPSGAAAKTKVEVFTWWTEGGEKAGLDGLVSVLNQKYPNVAFENGAVAGGAGSNAKAVLAQRLQSNDPPDTFQAHAGLELSDYIKAGQIEDISGLYQSEGWDKVFPQTLIDTLTVDGKIYSVPANIHRANVVWANPEVLKKANLSTTEFPATIDAWLTDLQKLKDAGVQYPLAVAKDWTQAQLLETVLIADLGADGYKGLWTGSTKWDDAKVATALDHYAALMKFTNTDRDGLDWPDALKYVMDGKAAYNVMGDWAVGSYDQAGKKLNTDYLAFPVPGTKGIFDFLADSFTLPKGAKHADAAKDWLKVVGSAEGQKAFNTKKGSIPARTDASASDYGPYQQSAMEDFKKDTVVPSLQHGAATSIAWLTDIDSAIGQFSSTGDVGTLKKGLIDAASKNLAG